MVLACLHSAAAEDTDSIKQRRLRTAYCIGVLVGQQSAASQLCAAATAGATVRNCEQTLQKNKNRATTPRNLPFGYTKFGSLRRRGRGARHSARQTYRRPMFLEYRGPAIWNLLTKMCDPHRVSRPLALWRRVHFTCV
jgi:hypothetical protein